jgi:hypothetical protein
MTICASFADRHHYINYRPIIESKIEIPVLLDVP